MDYGILMKVFQLNVDFGLHWAVEWAVAGAFNSRSFASDKVR
jgi:hypothetical protein